MTDRRRSSIDVTTTSTTPSHIMQYFTVLAVFGQNFATLLSGRIIAGLYTGMTSLVVPTYIGEIASADIRGALGSSFQLMVTIGILYAYLFGAIIDSWRILAVVCAVPTVIYGVLLFFIKESPTFLVAKGKDKQAKEVLKTLRGKDYNIDAEFKTLQDIQEEMNRNSVTLKDLMEPYILKPVLICLATMLFQQCSGINAVLFNLSTIFKEAGVGLEDNISAIVVGAVQVLATAAAVPLIDRAGRKILLTGSAIFMTISLVALGVFFYEVEQGVSLAWLPLTSLIIYISAFSLGYGPVPWVLMGEMFSLEVRAAASGLATLSNWGTSFLITLLFSPLQSVIHDYGIYWLFGGICLVNIFFSLLIVPETKGKSVQEISAYFGAPSNQEKKTCDPETQARIDTSLHL